MAPRVIGDASDAMLAGLNPAQREAVEHLHGPLLVLAGAGSGKTRVLTTRIARLIDQHGVPPERIFAVTFTNKAAGEMKERVGRLLGRDPSGLWIGTFHSLSARLLRREAERLGFSRQFTIYDEDDRLSLIRRLLAARGYAPKPYAPKLIQSIISAAKNRMTTAAELAAQAGYDRITKAAAEIFDDLTAALRTANAMDFDDLMLHPLRLFREHPDRLAVYQQRFSFILVDEFQDTNAAQYLLVKLLGAHGNVSAVGDDDQSIYGWRGADVRNMRQFQDDFAGTRIVRLEENYRSTGIILAAANGVIAENAGRLGKTLRTRRRGGEAVTVLAAADERDEAEWMVRELGRRRAQGDWDYREMAVLYRTNAQSRAFEEALRRAGVPYRIVGAISFYDRREVKDVLAYLRLVANPADDEAFLRAIGVPRRGLGESSLVTLGNAAAQWRMPLLEAARAGGRVPELRPNAREALEKFAALVDALRDQATQAPAEILERIVEAIHYEELLVAEGPEGADRWENVRELLAAAAEWSEVVGAGEDDGGTPLERFLAEAALLSSADTVHGATEGVTLMTLHTAKGLEWPVVALAGMEEGLFPLSRSRDTEGGLEEERRLCYVGITRAKDKLYFSWARSRRRGGELMPGLASSFLRALPAEVVEEQRTSGVGVLASWRAGGRVIDRAAGSRWEERARSDPEFGGALPPSGGAAGAPDEPSQDLPRFVHGERVRHRKFGSGTIRGLTGAGRDLKVSVAFDDAEVGVKQLLVAYAGLERDWESA